MRTALTLILFASTLVGVVVRARGLVPAMLISGLLALLVVG